MPAITAAANPAVACVDLTVSGLTASQSFLVLRRDSNGLRTVRYTNQGGLTADGAGAAALPDYEPTQGYTHEYILADTDGAFLASVTFPCPEWGTWLKSPGRPSLNVPSPLNRWGPADSPLRVDLVPIRGSRYPVALSEERQAPELDFTTVTLTRSQTAAVRELFADATVVLLDAPYRFDIPGRYFSVPTVREVPADDYDLEWAARLFSYRAQVVAEPTHGVYEQTGVIYTDLDDLYATYAALAADVTLYQDIPLLSPP